MKISAAVLGLLLSSCTLDSVMPDELTLGHGSSVMDGTMGFQDPGYHDWDMTSETTSTAVALTWDLPSISDGAPKADRHGTLSSSVIVAQETQEDASDPFGFPESMGNGSDGTFDADWRHAATFGGVLVLLLIILLIRLQRSNGWH